MRRLRELTSKFGHETSGSDVASGGHDQKNVYGAELVVFSSAVNLDNEELVYAREKSLPVGSRAQYLAKISERFNSTVAVSGTHGKTTATAMTATAMRSL
ncbi:MAG: UDP-N-acetylmuramate--L-alanine ligase, partial [Clostridia bacterium]|nr:UDP-N-acetylmuramate--L-alanine ligase [Clostridia bacterium]